ncbi:Uncharacterized protein dnl_42190 [Desulfonema limicola]|uniref:Uncharacterized protein n=1 Tax=Desulfonema limicola TaxID=45656 RepID=A0A975BAS5_9BACT|nr:Uncharacterized protein dnl_42190 [Desulfonema limicola]
MQILNHPACCITLVDCFKCPADFSGISDNLAVQAWTT